MIRQLSMVIFLAATCQFALADQAFDDNLKKATKGDIAAQRNTAASYHYGRGVTQDYEKARGWFLKAAEKGDAESQYYLGMVNNIGQGVKQDYAQAAAWYEKAAAQNHSQAQYSLGVLYENGRGVKQDYKKAAALYAKAAEQGSPDAKKASDALAQKIAAEEAATKAQKTNTTPKK